MTRHDYARELNRLERSPSEGRVAAIAAVLLLAFFAFYWFVGGAA